MLALFGYPGVLVFLALVSACATALTWTATWRVTSDAAASWFGWAAAALSAPFFFQSFVVYPDAPGAALVMVGVLALVDDRPLSTQADRRHGRGTGAAAVAAHAIRRGRGDARPDAVRARLAPPLAASRRCCRFRFSARPAGSRFSTRSTDLPIRGAPYGGSTQSDIANLGRGIVGLLFDQQFGVLPAAPVLLCALAGLVVLMRRSPRLAAALLLLVTPYGLVVGTYQMWWGGNSSPGRFIIPIMLPLAIPAGVWFQTRRGHTGKLLGLGALTVSLLTTITLAGVDRGILLYNFRDGSSRLLTWLSPLVNITSGFPSVFQTTTSAAFLHGVVWIAAIALTAAAGMLVERRGAARDVHRPRDRVCGHRHVSDRAVDRRGKDAVPLVRDDAGGGHRGVPRQSRPRRRQVAIRYSPDPPRACARRADEPDAGRSGRATPQRASPAIALFRLPAGVYGVEGEARPPELGR